MESVFSAEEYSETVFEKLAFDREEIRNKVFQDCVFRKCDFSECDLTGTEFSDCRFESCRINLSRFTNVSVKSMAFIDSKLVGIDFTRCTINFFELTFEGCLMDACNFSGLPMAKTNFEGCTIRECLFGETDLRKAVFANCDLEGSSFHGTNLEEADFLSARNYLIDPTANKIEDARFSLPEAVSLLRAFKIKLS